MDQTGLAMFMQKGTTGFNETRFPLGAAGPPTHQGNTHS
jgi:hypothetical protein